MSKVKIPVADRFWSKVNKNGPVPAHRPELGPCWLWTGGTSSAGYGNFTYMDEQGNQAWISAHRYSWIESDGDPGDLFVLHGCDTRRCVRRHHLFIGDSADNAHDCISKGRHRGVTHPETYKRGDENWVRLNPDKLLRGEDNPRSIVTKAVVIEIREMWSHGRGPTEIGKKFGISKNLAYAIYKRKIWRHV